jgi:hypothetical protein
MCDLNTTVYTADLLSTCDLNTSLYTPHLLTYQYKYIYSQLVIDV